MVVAITALVVAASGTAVAAGHLVKGDKLIKKHSLSGNRLKNNTITGKQINMSKLGTVPSATTATTATTAGSAAVSRLDYESATVGLPASSATFGSATANCPAGLNAIGGGAKVSSEEDDYVNDAYPSSRTAWTADGFNGTSSTTDTMTVYVICAQAAKTTP